MIKHFYLLIRYKAYGIIFLVRSLSKHFMITFTNFEPIIIDVYGNNECMCSGYILYMFTILLTCGIRDM